MKKLTADGDYSMPVLSEHEKQRLINFCKADLPNWSPDGDYYPLLRIALAALMTEPAIEVKEAAEDLLKIIDDYPEQLVPINRESAVVRNLRDSLHQTVSVKQEGEQ